MERNLITVDEMNERCQKTKKEFKDKYADDPKNYVIENVKLDKYQYVLKEIIDEEDYGKIRKYLPRILVYLIIGIIDIIFIIFSLILSSSLSFPLPNPLNQNFILFVTPTSFPSL